MQGGRLTDRVLTVLALIGISMPVFWLGAVCSTTSAYKTGIFPSGGYVEAHRRTRPNGPIT